jgi:hypothetical protein
MSAFRLLKKAKLACCWHMATSAFPERVQAQKLVSELAERLGSALNEAGARSILEIEIAGPSAERRRELAEKANDGALTSEEFADYETYAQLRGLLAILQSKARICLQRQGRD